MTKLSVNINKIATLRNARGQNLPDVVKTAEDIISYGVHGITVHPRPDERHIRRDDVYALHQLIARINGEREMPLEFNIEGYPGSHFLQMIAEVRPHQCTLVPDPPDVITSNAGWDTTSRFDDLKSTLKTLKELGVRASLFMDPAEFTSGQADSLRLLKPDRIELYTENWAKAYTAQDQQAEKWSETVNSYKSLASFAVSEGIELNAGHDLNQENLASLITHIPDIKEVSIGHALVCEALYDGLEQTVANYLNILATLR